MILSGALCGQIVDRFGRRYLVLAVCMARAIFDASNETREPLLVFGMALFAAVVPTALAFRVRQIRRFTCHGKRHLK